MTSLGQIREAIETTLSTVIAPKVNVYRHTPMSVITPAILIMPASGNYQQVHGNRATGWEFDLVVLAGPADTDRFEPLLDEMVDAHGTRSVVAAIAANPGLGIAQHPIAAVQGLSNYGIRYQVGEVEFIGATLRLFVIATH